MDSPQPIGHRATISAPHMHANACQSLLTHLRPGCRVLDVGSGSGYLTHVLAELVQPGGRVVGVDHIQPLVDLAAQNTAKSEAGRHFLETGVIKYVKADGRRGFAAGGPYNAIHVGAAAAEHHKALEEQLTAPGRLFVPVVEGAQQYIFVVDKDEEGGVTRQKEYGVRYVPLTDPPAATSSS